MIQRQVTVDDLNVHLRLPEGDVPVLRGINMTLGEGERVGVVGESGAGKSVLGAALMGLLRPPLEISRGRIEFQGRDLTTMAEPALRRLRGDRMAMIFQDPLATLNPVLTIGDQLIETLRAHRSLSRRAARDAALAGLQQVQVPSAAQRMRQYPHELSGGLRQRAVIAMALLLEPAVIIADEPTTAVDVTLQAQIMALLVERCRQQRTGLLLITHDLAVVAQTTHRILVMYAGRVVESGPTREVITAARHPYTRGLLAALPQRGERGRPLAQIPGNMPSVQDVPSGCPFHPRCPLATTLCSEVMPAYRPLTGDHWVACHDVDPATTAGR